jgi:hypothetical protein
VLLRFLQHQQYLEKFSWVVILILLDFLISPDSEGADS